MKNNITLTGMMGAGKSLIAEKLSQHLSGYVAVDTDILIEYHYNQFIPDMFAQKGEKFFRDAESKILDMVYKKDKLIVALGGGAFERPENREVIKKNSRVIYLKARPETLFERIANCKTRPMLKDGFGVKEVEEILQRREQNYFMADYVVETDGKTPNDIVKEILGLLND
ncbi:MAG: shikimate kinase [Fusobacterium sp.]|nr:shikimate kinase [Fusobacterium sp.]